MRQVSCFPWLSAISFLPHSPAQHHTSPPVTQPAGSPSLQALGLILSLKGQGWVILGPLPSLTPVREHQANLAIVCLLSSSLFVSSMSKYTSSWCVQDPSPCSNDLFLPLPFRFWPNPILWLVPYCTYGTLSILSSAHYLILAFHLCFQHLTEYCACALNHTTKVCSARWASLLAYN